MLWPLPLLIALGSTPHLSGQCSWAFSLFMFEFLRVLSCCSQGWPQIAISLPQCWSDGPVSLYLALLGVSESFVISCEFLCECDTENSHFLDEKTRRRGLGRIQWEAPLTPPREQQLETCTLSFIIPALVPLGWKHHAYLFSSLPGSKWALIERRDRPSKGSQKPDQAWDSVSSFHGSNRLSRGPRQG